MPEHQENLLTCVQAILNDWDPLSLFPAAPPDEYEAEAKAVAVRVATCRSEADVQACLYEVFAKAFGEIAPKWGECGETAERIWEDARRLKQDNGK